MYTEKELVGVAKRKNNTKRSYLVVNRLQGKHVPVAPHKALAMFRELAGVVKEACKGERLLLIGFAETATAIGSALAIELQAPYLQTTRETIPGAEYLYFSESHSHASEQRLVRNDLPRILAGIDRVVFVEDEVTTGNTILNIIRILQKEYPGNFHFSAASLLNGMNPEFRRIYAEQDISLFYLVKTCHDSYSAAAEAWQKEGVTHAPELSPSFSGDFQELTLPGAVNARCLTSGKPYQEACEQLFARLQDTLPLPGPQRILVLGTEEFMYPALYVGSRLEELGHTVRCHATTRSPIMPGTEDGYPLREAYELVSMYEEGRTTYLYDLAPYDLTLILTDSPSIPENGKVSLQNALASCGNTKICLIRWCPS